MNQDLLTSPIPAAKRKGVARKRIRDSTDLLRGNLSARQSAHPVRWRAMLHTK
jgi:hypothetical protein